MTEQEEMIRAADAKHLLSNPMYREAWEIPRERIIKKLESSISDDERRDLNYLLRAFRVARSYAEQVIETGKLAEEADKQKRSFADRMLRRA